MGILIIYLVVTTLAVLAIFAAMGVSARSGHFMEVVEDAPAGEMDAPLQSYR